MDDLITFLVDAVRSGAIPKPAARENIDDYRLRVAHAGAMVALSWLQQHQELEVEAAAEAAAAVAEDGATVTPLVATPVVRDA
jgi:hypothetical protein